MNQIIYDVIVIGAGPAGITAGIYTARGGLRSLVIESFSPTSQVINADLIENYPGFPEGIGGFDLLERFKNQAKNCGVEFQEGKVEDIGGKENHLWQVKTKDKTFDTSAIILATGTRYKQLGVDGEKKFCGKGVSYCAICDGAFFKDKDIVIVGGGNAAVEEALYLTRFARKVILVHRRKRLRADSVLAKRASENKKIEIIFNSTITQIYGTDKVGGVLLKNVIDETNSKRECSGVFISIGQIPNTEFLSNIVELDKLGYIISDERMMTSQPGIFACGDCRAKFLRQVVTACAEGAQAAVGTVAYVDRLKGQAYDG